jgi:hypothetical protein
MSLEAWGDDGDADRPYTQERVDEIVAEATQSILAERDALAEREGKLRQALRKHAIVVWFHPADGPDDEKSGKRCLQCRAEWEMGSPERHAPDCLAKEPDRVREEE